MTQNTLLQVVQIRKEDVKCLIAHIWQPCIPWEIEDKNCRDVVLLLLKFAKLQRFTSMYYQRWQLSVQNEAFSKGANFDAGSQPTNNLHC